MLLFAWLSIKLWRDAHWAWRKPHAPRNYNTWYFYSWIEEKGCVCKPDNRQAIILLILFFCSYFFIQLFSVFIFIQNFVPDDFYVTYNIQGNENTCLIEMSVFILKVIVEVIEKTLHSMHPSVLHYSNHKYLSNVRTIMREYFLTIYLDELIKYNGKIRTQ